MKTAGLGSGAMSGTALTPNRALVNTQLGCSPHWALTNAQFGFLTPDSVA